MTTTLQSTTILEFLSCKLPETKEDADVDALSECLSDGTHLYRFLYMVSDTYFDLNQLIDLDNDSDNWVLKQTNLRKVVRDLELFYEEELGVSFGPEDESSETESELQNDVDHALQQIDVSAIAKCEDKELCRKELMKLCGFVLVAAVQSKDKSIFVDRIMRMTPEKQLVMKEIIENVLAIDPFCSLQGKVDESTISLGGVDSSFDISFQVNSQNGLNVSPLKTDVSNATYDNGDDDDDDETTLVTSDVIISDSPEKSSNISQALKLEELESTNRALTTQLEKKEKLLKETEDKLRQVRVNLDEKIKEIGEKDLRLEDELNLSQDQAQKIRKLEALIVGYKEKLENVGIMSDQMHELEERSSKLMNQMMSMEDTANLVPGLQEKVSNYSKTIDVLSIDLSDAKQTIKVQEEKITDLSNLLAAAEHEKESVEIELSGAREMIEIQKYEKAGKSSNDSKILSTTPDDATLLRLQQENSKLMKKVSELESSLCTREIEDRLIKLGESKRPQDNKVEAIVHDVVSEEILEKKYPLRMVIHRLLGILAAPFVVIAVFLLTDLLVLSCPAPF